MTRAVAIIELAHWWSTPSGRYLLAWEQAHVDALVNDLFGFHALQIDQPQLDALRANRMPHRWLAARSTEAPDEAAAWDMPPVDESLTTLSPDAAGEHGGRRRAHLLAEAHALPFADQSLDLVVLPHTLELATDAHDALREVARVLRPEGRVIVLGFNPLSLWGLRQGLAHLRERCGGRPPAFLPRSGEFIRERRIRDWLRLLSFDVEEAAFGCWRPPLRSERWLRRSAWLDHLGRRWLPGVGAVYAVQAVKRVRGMRMVGLAREARAATAVGARARPVAAPVVSPAAGSSASAPHTSTATIPLERQRFE